SQFFELRSFGTPNRQSACSHARTRGGKVARDLRNRSTHVISSGFESIGVSLCPFASCDATASENHSSSRKNVHADDTEACEEHTHGSTTTTRHGDRDH